MNKRQIFHLSIAVSDLDEAKKFYLDVLGASAGRFTDTWEDVLLWGHQITLQLKPNEVLPLDKQGNRHFGFVLEWDDWETEKDRLVRAGVKFLSEPALLLAETPEEQAKMYLADPSNNIIEIKTYRNIDRTLCFE